MDLTDATGKPRKPIVMLVDDDQNVLMGLKLTLARHCTVLTCDNAVDAVKRILTEKPDIIVLDIKMPNKDGFWVFRELRQQEVNTPVIFNSAYQDAVLPADLADTYKPFAILSKQGNAKEFIATIKSAASASGYTI